MPELPEVESVRLSLLPHVLGRTLASVEVRRVDVVSWAPGALAETRAGRLGAALLAGARVTSIERRGKQLALASGPDPSDRALVVQLGMTGQLFCLPPGAHLPHPTHVHLIWKLDTGARLVFRDARRFGGVTVLPDRRSLETRWHELGPDALTIDAPTLGERLRGSSRAIKTALLDQGVLAGVGNIYADESLFRAGITPGALAKRLSAPQLDRLAAAIRDVLAEAVAAGGSSLADGTYVDADGNPGNFQLRHAVYGRRGERCRVCQAPLRSGLYSNRTTVWCPKCQRAR